MKDKNGNYLINANMYKIFMLLLQHKRINLKLLEEKSGLNKNTIRIIIIKKLKEFGLDISTFFGTNGGHEINYFFLSESEKKEIKEKLPIFLHEKVNEVINDEVINNVK